MRKETLKAIRTAFDSWATSHGFSRIAKPGMYYWKDEWVYALDDVNSGTRIVLVLSPNPNGSESFSVDLGWSRLGRLPELPMRPCGGRPDGHKEAASVEYMTRLGYLAPADQDFYDVGAASAGPAAIGSIAKSVGAIDMSALESIDAAIADLVRFGIPYLSRVLGIAQIGRPRS